MDQKFTNRNNKDKRTQKVKNRSSIGKSKYPFISKIRSWLQFILNPSIFSFYPIIKNNTKKQKHLIQTSLFTKGLENDFLTFGFQPFCWLNKKLVNDYEVKIRKLIIPMFCFLGFIFVDFWLLVFHFFGWSSN